MKRLIYLIILLCAVVGTIAAQDEPTPYAVALQRIEEARASQTTFLALSELGLTELPSEIGQLTQLLELNLDDNNLTQLPPEIGQLTNLNYLSLSRNNLTTLPPEIGQLRNLWVLGLSYNQIRSLPAQIGDLHNLEWLYINDNQITYLPYELVHLQNIDVFEAYPNPLESPSWDIVYQGFPAIQAYLREQRAHQIRTIIVSVASLIGLMAIIGLLWRKRQMGGYKQKRKIGAST